MVRSSAVVFVALSALCVCLSGTEAGLKKSDSKVKITAKASELDASGKQTITLTIQIAPGWHIHANPVKNEGYEVNATTVRVLAGKDELKAAVAYPPGEQWKKSKEPYMIYDGAVVIPVQITRADAKAPLTIQVKVSACDDDTCLPSGTVALAIP